MKAVLLLNVALDDMPDGCLACRFCEVDCQAECKCMASRHRKKIDEVRYRPNWCPLRGLPERKNTISLNDLEKEAKENHVKVDAQAGFNLGWNACLDEILGMGD